MQIIDPVQALDGYSRSVKEVQRDLPANAKAALERLASAMTALDSLRKKRVEKQAVSEEELRIAFSNVEGEILRAPYLSSKVEPDVDDEFEVIDEYGSYEEVVYYAIEFVVSLRRELKLVNSAVLAHRKEFEAVITAYLYAGRAMIGLTPLPDSVQHAYNAAQRAIEAFEKSDAFDSKLFSEQVLLLIAELKHFPVDESAGSLFAALGQALNIMAAQVVPDFVVDESGSEFSGEDFVDDGSEEEEDEDEDHEDSEDESPDRAANTRDSTDQVEVPSQRSPSATETPSSVPAIETIPLPGTVVDRATHRADEHSTPSSSRHVDDAFDGPRLVYTDESESGSNMERSKPVAQAPAKQSVVAQDRRAGSSILDMRTAALQSDMSKPTQNLLRRREAQPGPTKPPASRRRPLRNDPPPLSFLGFFEAVCSIITCGSKHTYEA